MTTIIIVPPPPIVTVAAARAHLRIDGTEQDAEIAALVAAAQGTIDGPNGWLGRALGPQTLELQLAGFGCGPVGLPYGPIVAVESVKSVDPDGSLWSYDPATYGLEAGRFLRRVPGASWRATADRSDALRIRYAAGWPITDGAWTGPAPIRHAVLMMVSRLYAQHGEDVSASLVEDRTVHALLAPWRVWSL